jgi:hypothetical protein
MMSVGIVRNFARTGTTGENGAKLGNDDSSSITPTFFFGKGFGDLPIGRARAFAITGELDPLTQLILGDERCAYHLLPLC